jgi:hypothetical protein
MLRLALFIFSVLMGSLAIGDTCPSGSNLALIPVCKPGSPASAACPSGYTEIMIIPICETLPPGFYVATTGSDSNAGTLAAPFATLGKCKRAMRGRGTAKTCYIRAGSYAPAAGDPTICKGTKTCAVALQSPADNNETWSYYPPDGVNSADITGRSTASGNGLWAIFFVGNATGITINGLSMHNFQYSALSSGGGNNSWTATNNIIFNGFCVVGVGACSSSANAAGIQCYGCHNATITNNVVHDMASFGISFNNVNGDISGLNISSNVVYNTCTGLADCGAIYAQDLNATATGIQIKNNYVRDGNTFASAGNTGSAIYLDDCMSNVSVTGNVLTGKNGLNTTHIHGGSNDVFTGNLIDLATFGQKTMALQTSSGTGCSAGTMSGNQFQNSVIISGGGGGGYNVLSGSPVNAPAITNNAYHNYAGSAISSGGSYSDANPVSEDPQLACWIYSLASGSPVFNTPVSFPGLTGGWGPPGFVIPTTGTPPSSPHTCF